MLYTVNRSPNPAKFPAQSRRYHTCSLLLGLGLLLAGLNTSPAATILVRQDGTGNYTTIQAAVNAMAAKDTIMVGPGTYPERITFPSGKSGTAGSLTTLKTETPGTVEMWGFDTANCNFLHIEGFNVSVPTNMASNPGISIESSNLEIVSNYVHDVLGVGIYSLANYNNNSVISNHIYNIGMGIIIWGTNCVVAGNNLERLRYYDPLGDADYIIFFGSNLELSNNFMHGSVQSEIGPAHVDGFSSWDNNAQFVQHVRIEDNRMQDFYHEGFIVAAAYYSNSFDITICNNIFQDAAAWGVLAFNNLRDVKIYNNLFKDIPSYGVGVNNNATGEVYNNIFYNVTGWDSGTSPAIGSKNIWYIPGGSVYGHFNGDLVNVNPLFVNTNGNFYLQSNSPAIDAGVVATNVPVDIVGTPRPQGAGWDIGPYEYIPGGASGSGARFTSSAVQNGALVLTLSGSIGSTYGILVSTNMQSWAQVASVTLTNGSALVNLPLNGSKLFYRAMFLH